MSTTQKMSLTGAVLMNVNLMVGASAFIGPGMMAKYADSASFYGWLFAAVIFFPVVWCIAQITKHFPGKGSFYSYPKNTISPAAGFISGWVYFLGYVSIGALQLMSLNEILIKQCNCTFLMQYGVAFNMVLVGALLALGMCSIGIVDRVQSSATVFKLTPLIIGVVSLLYYFNPSQTPFVTSTSPMILLPTIPMAIFGFWGFEGVCSISHLVQDSKRNAGRSIMIGFITAVSIYCLFHLGLLSIMGSAALQQFGAVAFVNYMGITSPLLLAVLRILVVSAILVAHINAIFGGIVANSAMFCAMAEEKLLFLSSVFSRRTARTQRPIGAGMAHCVGILFCIALLANKEVLNAVSNLGVLVAFFMAILSLIVVQRTRREWWGQAMSVLGLASCALLCYYSWQIIGVTTMERLAAVAPLMAVTVLGYVMYAHTARASS